MAWGNRQFPDDGVHSTLIDTEPALGPTPSVVDRKRCCPYRPAFFAFAVRPGRDDAVRTMVISNIE